MMFAELLNLIPGANMLIPISAVIYRKSLVLNYTRAISEVSACSCKLLHTLIYCLLADLPGFARKIELKKESFWNIC